MFLSFLTRPWSGRLLLESTENVLSQIRSRDKECCTVIKRTSSQNGAIGTAIEHLNFEGPVSCCRFVFSPVDVLFGTKVVTPFLVAENCGITC
jgi:hypothetical protein